MSAPYSAEDVRAILGVFVGEFLVDVPSSGVDEKTTRMYFGGSGDGVPITTRELRFNEGDLGKHIFLDADDEWFQSIADYTNAEG